VVIDITFTATAMVIEYDTYSNCSGHIYNIYSNCGGHFIISVTKVLIDVFCGTQWLQYANLV